MGRYLLRRVFESLVVLLVMSFVVYGLLGLMPGDPVEMMVQANPNLTAADIQNLRQVYGVDEPILERYLAWLGSALSGDLGYSRLFAVPVGEVLLPRLGNTLLLMGAAFVIAFGIALPAGIAAARRPWGAVDGLVNLTAFAGISVPPFWLAILLIILFSVTLGWLPAGGMGSGSLGSTLLYMVLPVIAAFCYATSSVLVRFYPPEIPSAAIQFGQQTATCALATIVVILFVDPVPIATLGDAGLFVIMGALGGTGVLSLAIAYRLADPSSVSPFEYFGIPVSFALGWLFFAEAPFDDLFPGILFIVGAGIIIMLRERHLSRLRNAT